MAEKRKSKKTATQIPHDIEKRIVEVSLQNPDYGARRLVPLLEQDRIRVTASAVYSILKRNNLKNRSLRLSKLKEQHLTEIVPEPIDTTPPSDRPAGPHPPDDAETTSLPVHLVSKIPSRTKTKSLWSLNPLNILLLGLVGYFWVSALGNLLEARREPTLPHVLAPVVAETIPQATVRPLEDYSIIYERNLFGGSTEETPASDEMVSIEDIPAAEKTLGLKLVGTVAGDDSTTSFAIIDNKTTHKQELYHEGDKAGDVLIKKILRNKVIVDAGKGEELLTLDLQESGERLKFPATQQLADWSQPATQEDVERKRLPGRYQSLQLDREAITVALSDKDRVMSEASLTSYTVYDRASGLKISNIKPDSIFARLGLRNGDVIKGVNDVTITGPEQAAELFETLRQGGNVTILVKGTRRSRRIELEIK